MDKSLAQHYTVQARYDKERSGILIDAAVAIAITVIGVQMPTASEIIESGKDVSEVDFNLSVNFWLNYVVCFIVIVNIWTVHIRTVGEFENVRSATSSLNTLWLFCLASIPYLFSAFSTVAWVQSDPELQSVWARLFIAVVWTAQLLRESLVFIERGLPDLGSGFWTRAYVEGPWNPEKLFIKFMVCTNGLHGLVFGFTWVIPATYSTILLAASGLLVELVRWHLNVKKEPHLSPKVRLIQLSDGVFAISATLLSLEAIQVKNQDTLVAMYINFGFFAASFITVMLMWHINHAFFHNVRENIPGKVFKLGLLLLVGVPIAVQGYRSMYDALYPEEANTLSQDELDLAVRNSAFYVLGAAGANFFTMLVLLLFVSIKHPDSIDITLEFIVSEGDTKSIKSVSEKLRRLWFLYMGGRCSGSLLVTIICLTLAFTLEPRRARNVLFGWIAAVLLNSICCNLWFHFVLRLKFVGINEHQRDDGTFVDPRVDNQNDPERCASQSTSPLNKIQSEGGTTAMSVE